MTDQTPLNSFCDTCQSTFRAVSNYAPEMEWLKKVPFQNIQAIMSSAEDGCHLCSLILSEMSPNHVEEQLEDLINHPERAWDQLSIEIMVRRRMGAESLPDLGVPLVSLNESRNRAGVSNTEALCNFAIEQMQDLPTSHLAASTGSPETIDQIRRWIAGCEINHQGCISRRRSCRYELPTRLIDIGRLTSESVVRLCTSSYLPSDTKYTTLSYSWGSNLQLKLTSEEYGRFVSGLRSDDLPQTFQDAAVLTSRLGINYLWIDSMCIIQDDPSDWEVEAARMAGVYQGAFLNISANAYSSPRAGLFQARNPLSVVPAVVEIDWRPLGWIRQAVTVFPRNAGIGHLQEGVLSTRAWTVQERLLAYRTVHFLRQKVMWECTSLVASESSPEGKLEDRVGWADPFRRWATLDGSPVGDWDLSRKDQWLNKWLEVQRVYTQGNLTFQTDKLMAIAGIAEYMRSLWRGNDIRYLAGLWSHRLEESLLWEVSSERFTPLGIADARAPSWSWARRQGVIHVAFLHPGESTNILVAILKAKTNPIGNPLGPVSGGCIRVRGPMCLVKVEPWHSGADTKLLLAGLHVEFTKLEFDDGRLPMPKEGVLFLLGVMKRPHITGCPISGLVLQLTHATKGEYVRVGVWEMNDDDMSWKRLHQDEEDWYQLVQREFTAMGLDEGHFEEENCDDKTYTISIK